VAALPSSATFVISGEWTGGFTECSDAAPKIKCETDGDAGLGRFLLREGAQFCQMIQDRH